MILLVLLLVQLIPVERPKLPDPASVMERNYPLVPDMASNYRRFRFI